MKYSKLYLFTTLILLLFIIGCSSSQELIYRPNDPNEKNWNIEVKKDAGSFLVTINDSTVIDEGANFFTGNLETKTNYKNKEIKLIVNHSTGFLGIGAGDNSMLFIDNELIGKFDFK